MRSLPAVAACLALGLTTLASDEPCDNTTKWTVRLIGENNSIQCTGAVLSQPDPENSCLVVVGTATHCFGKVTDAWIGPKPMKARVSGRRFFADLGSSNDDLSYVSVVVQGTETECRDNLAVLNTDAQMQAATVGTVNASGGACRVPCAGGNCRLKITNSGSPVLTKEGKFAGVVRAANENGDAIFSLKKGALPLDRLLACEKDPGKMCIAPPGFKSGRAKEAHDLSGPYQD